MQRAQVRLDNSTMHVSQQSRTDVRSSSGAYMIHGETLALSTRLGLRRFEVSPCCDERHSALGVAVQSGQVKRPFPNLMATHGAAGGGVSA